MQGLEAVPALRVLREQGVEGMRVSGHEPPELVLRQDRRHVLDQGVEQPFLARQPLGVGQRLLFRAEHGPVDAEPTRSPTPGLVVCFSGTLPCRRHPGKGARRVLAPGVEAPVVLHVEQDVDGARAPAQDPYRRPGTVGPLRPAPLVLAESIAVPEGLFEDVLQFGRHVHTVEGGLAHSRHDRHHVDLLRADPQAVAAGRAQPQVRVDKQVGAGLDLAVDLAGPVVAHHVDRTDSHALPAAVTPFERLAPGQGRDGGEAVRTVIRENAGLEHPVPHGRQVDLAPRDRGRDRRVFLLHRHGRDFSATDRHRPNLPGGRRRAGGGRGRATAG